MKFKKIVSVFLVFISFYSYGQNFEGEISYKNTFKSKYEKLTNEQLSSIIGTEEQYFIAGSNYKTMLNGKAITEQIFESKTNRLYNKSPNSDTLYWFDASINSDTVISFTFQEKAAVILGYSCNAITLKTVTGSTTMFYSDRLKLDSEGFKAHKYGNWAFYTQKTGSLPLKIIVDNNQFTMESTATEINSKTLPKTFFVINSLTPTKESL